MRHAEANLTSNQVGKSVGILIVLVSGFLLISAMQMTMGQERLQSESIVPLVDGSLLRSGSMGFLVRFPKAVYPDPQRTDAEIESNSLRLVETPLFSVFLCPERDSIVLRPELRRRPPAQPLGGIAGNLGSELSRLEADQWYHMAVVWDVDANRFKLFLNGIEQESLSNAEIPFWQDGAPDLEGSVSLGAMESELEFRDLQFSDSTDPATAFASAISEVQPLRGEGRSLAAEKLNLSDYQKTLVYENAFTEPLNLIPERDLFADGSRVREPGPDQWVLEGDGNAIVQDGALVLETNDFQPPPHWDGEKIVSIPSAHLVLWLNRRFPDGILVEYTMEPHDSRRGLHILFFSATPPDGGSIFRTGLKKRDGVFKNYVRNPGELVSYHISFWGSPYTWRGTSHLRKNNHFTMLAVGDDRISHRGERPYPIRVLKDGGIIRAEVDGAIVIDFEDDGERNGPIYKDGYLGFRMMGDAQSIQLRDLKIWKLEPRPK